MPFLNTIPLQEYYKILTNYESTNYQRGLMEGSVTVSANKANKP